MADIELVIKIPEEIYEASQILDVKYEDTVQIPLEVIANGTPLPKCHGRLIDESDLIPDSDYEDGIFYAVSTGAIYAAQTIIEAYKAESEDVE